MMSVLLAVPVSASSVNTVEIRAIIHSDGSATMEEVWDINISNNLKTEWYVAKHYLDNMDILDLSVEEHIGDSVVPFETLSVWKEKASRFEKAGKCGLLSAKGGYEICWGFGESGHHKYKVIYTITNIVKAYQDGDAMKFNFLSEMAGGVDSVNIYLSSDHLSFEYPATRIWVSGYSATYNFVDDGIAVLGNDRFLKSDSAAILLAFDPGLLSPADKRAATLDEIINPKMGGSMWDNIIFAIVFIIALLFGIFMLPVLMIRKRRKQFEILNNAPYCRELPFEGNIGVAYARLCDIYKKTSGNIITCFLLKWIQTGQVEIVNTDFGKASIKLHTARPDLPVFEVSLYRMFIAAAGSDMILRHKDFKKWAHNNYGEIKRWLLEYRAFYKNELVNMGIYEVASVKHRFKKSNETEFIDTPLAQSMTMRAFGFKRYLGDFTRVNKHAASEGGQPIAGYSDWPFQSVDEREVREVWDQYLIFAHLFGIADRVEAQFKELYPDSFYQEDPRYIGGSLYLASIVATSSFSQSMQLLLGVFSGGVGGGAGGFSGGGGAGLR
jgi:hypothetical protein